MLLTLTHGRGQNDDGARDDGPNGVAAFAATVSQRSRWEAVDTASGTTALELCEWEGPAGTAPPSWDARGADGQLRRLGTAILDLTPGTPGTPHAADEARGLLVFGYEPGDGVLDEFHAWYDTEHCPRLSRVPGVLTVRRYQMVDDAGPRFMAIYGLTAPEVCSGEAWHEAALTPWTRRMASLAKQRVRDVYRRVGEGDR